MHLNVLCRAGSVVFRSTWFGLVWFSAVRIGSFRFESFWVGFDSGLDLTL